MQDTLARQAHIERTLRRIRAGIRRKTLTESVFAGLLGGLVVLFALFLLAMLNRPSPSLLVWSLVAVTYLTGSWLYVRWRMRTFQGDAAIARLVEANDDSYRNDVLAALEFGGEPATGDADRDELRRHLIERVSQRLEKDERVHDAVIPRGRVVPIVAALFGVATLALVFAMGAPTQASKSWQSMLGHSETVRTSEGELAVSRPVVSTLAVSVVPPGYSGLERRTVPSSTGDVEALAGSEITLRGRALEDVTSVTLVLDRGDEVQRREMTMDDARSFSGTLLAERSGDYHFEVVNFEDETVRDPIGRRLAVIPDEAPTIQIRQPVENLEVEPGDIIDFDYVVSDDFGISEVNFEWHFSGDSEDVRELPLLGEVAERRKSDMAAFDTAPMLLQPGDELVVMIEAFDNNSLTGPSRGVSRPISLSVASPNELNEEILVLKEQLFEDILSQLGAMLGHTMNTFAWDESEEQLRTSPAELSDEQQASVASGVAETNAKWAPVLDKMRALVELMSEDGLTSEREAALVEGAYQALYRQERDARAFFTTLETQLSAGLLRKSDFDEAASIQGEFVNQTERVTLVLEELIATQKADAVARALEELTATRDRLKDLLEQYRDTDDPYLKEQIEREMQRLAERMRELLDRLSEQVDELPWEHVNRDAMEQSEAQENVSNMGTSMEQMQKMLNEGDIEGALQALEQLSQSLDMLSQEFGDPLASGDPSTLSEFDRQVGEIMDEISDLEAKEQELERETTELEEEWRKERQREIQDELNKKLDDAKRRIASARERMSSFDREHMMDRTGEQLNEADDSLRRLADRLEEGDVAGAEEAAMRAVSELNDANRAVEFMERYVQGNPRTQGELGDAVEATRNGGEAASEVADAMRELMELAQPQPGAQGQQDVQEFAERQQQIGEQLGQLEGRLQEMGQQFPMMQDQFGEPLEQAGEGMRQAEGGLRRSQMRPAQEGQQQALDGLRSLRQQMQQRMAQRRQQQQANRRGESGRDSNLDQVEIPGQDEGGNRYREEVVEAMREGSLEAYDDEIRRYYESLVE